ncbi:MAG: ketol-acid reductoisomerase [Nitrososphaerota archaeon]|nr:ketol-acid reductoisomerase [Nitrososphaerota archaeon]MDG6931217.1 ketol-acid reductoisomerase [Nitrososphaerota archaeon]MDG6931880.1 ketol-acid reductoisomerase [Nitrososphaerota archaeon]MDG6936600.1 ketol-acid reductoisomerase [Nitrososphaerota archaeon]MDG6944394.1 ketol-acid reductoisomerase [Nitrososphaerota archaeon]
MVKIYYDSDTDASLIKSKSVAVIGYGSQGRAHALNLRDSGVKVTVGVREGGKSWEAAKRDGFKPAGIAEASKAADVICVLIPDTEHGTVYSESIAPNLKAGKALMFAHGYSIRFGLINPPKDVDVFMVAPKSPGPKLREAYQQGFGVPSLIAVGQDYTGKTRQLALSYAKAIGSTKVGVLETTFSEETEEDLFGEQAVLVGGLMYLINTGFETLVENGYTPELAYFEVLHEMKLIVDLVYSSGLTGMLKAVSDTAKYGGITKGPYIVNDDTKERMQELLKAIKDGSFAKEWTGNPAESRKRLEKMMQDIESLQIETVGKKIRKMAGLEK